MTILTAANLGQSFGAFDLFSGLSVSVPNDGKIGLVGPNGVGKTTLLLILAGLRSPTHGTVQRAKGARLGYLPQESAQAFTGREHTVYEEMLTVFESLRRDEARLREMEAEMANGQLTDELLAKYGAAQEQFERDGGYDYEVRLRQVLQGLGFGREDWDLPLAHLSGGQKTRALLARLLLERPDLLEELVVAHDAKDVTARQTALQELQNMDVRTSQFNPEHEIPEKSWAYRLVKRFLFHDFGAYDGYDHSRTAAPYVLKSREEETAEAATVP